MRSSSFASEELCYNTPDMEKEETETNFTLERLRLEREALALERERLAATRAHVEAEARLTKTRHPMLVPVSVGLLALLSFAGGLLVGISVMEGRQQRQREERLSRALSQLDALGAKAVTVGTNAPSASVGAPVPGGEHRNVSVVVFE